MKMATKEEAYPSNCLLLSWSHIDGMRHVLLRLVKYISEKQTWRDKITYIQYFRDYSNKLIIYRPTRRE